MLVSKVVLCLLYIIASGQSNYIPSLLVMRHNRKTRSFLVLSVNELTGVNNQIKPGCCAHGLPAGACPVCSQSGGGTLRQSDRNRKIGEITYHECAMIGNMLKARALAQKNHEANLQHRLDALTQFETAMSRLAEKMQQFVQMLSRSFITKPLAFVIQNAIIPIVNFIQNIPRFIVNFKTTLPEISDKLAAIYGEAKAFLNKKLEELLKVGKSMFEGFFKIFKKKNADDEDTKIDDDKKIFNLKTILHKVREKFKRKKNK